MILAHGWILSSKQKERWQVWEEGFCVSVETMYSLEARAICTHLCASLLHKGYLPFRSTLSPMASVELCSLFILSLQLHKEKSWV